MDELEKIKHALQQAQKQEKLLKLYMELADKRLIVIHELLDKIAFLTVDKDFKFEVKKYGNEDSKIVEEIEKQIKELVYE